jgi:hypothetical protein
MLRFEARARGDESKFKPSFTDAQRAKARETIINNTKNKNPTKKDVEDLLNDIYGIQQK